LEPQDLEYRINWEIYYTYYAGSSEMLLHKNGKFTMENLNNLYCRKDFFSLSTPRCETDLSEAVKSFIQNAVKKVLINTIANVLSWIPFISFLISITSVLFAFCLMPFSTFMTA